MHGNLRTGYLLSGPLDKVPTCLTKRSLSKTKRVFRIILKKMGRKIPGKKHHGVKDPLQQQAIRNHALKDKINAPPTNPDDQEMPKSVLEIARLINDVKAGKFDKKKKKKKRITGRPGNVVQFTGSGPLLPGMTQTDKILPSFQQEAGESEHRFVQRVDTAANDLLNEARMEEKHNVQVQRNLRGEVKTVDMGSKRNQPPVRPRKPMRGQSKLKKTDDKDGEEKPSQRLSRKNRLKLKRKIKNTDETEEKQLNRYESIQFGDVAHAPPRFSARPRGSSAISTKSSDKDLLAHRILSQTAGKKSHMEAALAEKRRQEAVDAYRQLKKLKT